MMTTYSGSVRDFDHAALAELPAYGRLRAALAEIGNEGTERGVRATLRGFLESLRDMALTAPLGEHCPSCAVPPEAWPHAVTCRADSLMATYRCPSCGHTWSAVHAID